MPGDWAAVSPICVHTVSNVRLGPYARFVLPKWLEVLLTFGAIARLTVLIRADRVTNVLRVFVWRHTRCPESMWRYWVTCAWCASIWVGAGVGGAWWAWHGHAWFQAGLLALTGSYLTGVAAFKDIEPPSEYPSVR